MTRISIITPSLNQGGFLEDTLRSILSQSHPAIETIVVDGGSLDNSTEILRRFAPRLTYWISETDRGQAHALNKGLARATGDIVGYLNSDDLYLPGAIGAVAEYFESHPGCEWLCGDTIFFGEGQRTQLVSTIVPKSVGHSLSWAYKAPQPGMFWRRALLAGGFEERWRYCFDHELYVRLLLRGYRCHHLPLPLAAYRLHDSSKTVAESEGFDREFDEIAALYEPALPWTARRWSRATRLLRASYAASRAGKAGSGASLLLRVLFLHPESVCGRPFWGCLRATMRALRAR